MLLLSDWARCTQNSRIIETYCQSFLHFFILFSLQPRLRFLPRFAQLSGSRKVFYLLLFLRFIFHKFVTRGDMGEDSRRDEVGGVYKLMKGL